MKKLISLILVLTMVLALAGCGGAPKSVSAKIGVLRGDASSEEALAWENYLKTLAASMNVEIDFSKALESADDELAALQNYASLGYNGVIVMTSYNGNNLLEKCQEYEIYMVCAAAHPDFEESEYSLAKNEEIIISDYTNYPYYVGASGPSNYGEVLAGYQMGKAGVDAGFTKYSVFTGSTAYGQPMHALRIAGFFAAMHDADPTVSYGGVECTMENWRAIAGALMGDLGVDLTKFSSEKYSILSQFGGYGMFMGDTAAVESVAYLSACEGVEAVFCAGSADGISMFAPETANVKYIGNDSLGKTFEDMFASEKLVFDVAKYYSYIGPAFAMLLKSIYDGEAVRVDGKPVSIEQLSLNIYGVDDYAVINSVECPEGGYFFSAQFLSAFILGTDLGSNASGYNKIDAKAFQEICSLDCTLSEGGLYAATKAVTEAYGDNAIFQFADAE